MPQMDKEEVTPAVFLGNLQLSINNGDLKLRIIDLFNGIEIIVEEHQIRIFHDKTRELKYCFVDLYDESIVQKAVVKLNQEISKPRNSFSNIVEPGSKLKVGKGKYEEAPELTKQSLYLGNLQKGTADDELRTHIIKLLKHYGTTVCEEHIRVFHNTDKEMKYCFVAVSDESTVNNLVKSMQEDAIPQHLKSAVVEPGLTLKVGKGKNAETHLTQAANDTTAVHSVYIGNLQKGLKDEELRQHIVKMFCHFTINVRTQQIRVFKNTDKGIRYCFVDFPDVNDMHESVVKLSNTRSIPSDLLKPLVATGLTLKVSKGKSSDSR